MLLMLPLLLMSLCRRGRGRGKQVVYRVIWVTEGGGDAGWFLVARGVREFIRGGAASAFTAAAVADIAIANTTIVIAAAAAGAGVSTRPWCHGGGVNKRDTAGVGLFELLDVPVHAVLTALDCSGSGSGNSGGSGGEGVGVHSRLLVKWRHKLWVWICFIMLLWLIVSRLLLLLMLLLIVMLLLLMLLWCLYVLAIVAVTITVARVRWELCGRLSQRKRQWQWQCVWWRQRHKAATTWLLLLLLLVLQSGRSIRTMQ